MNSHAIDYVLIGLPILLMAAWLVGFVSVWVKALLERAAMRKRNVEVYETTTQPTVSGTAFAFRAANRITYHNGKGTAFLVRAVRKEDITGGAGYYLPYNVKQLERGLFLAWEGAEPTPSAVQWIEVRGAYRFAPVPLDDEEDGEVAFVEEVK